MTSAKLSPGTRPLGASIQTPAMALILVGLVICVGMLFFHGHPVQNQVVRGANMAEAQRGGL